MNTTNRAAVLTKAHKVLKKHYQPVKPPADRSVLENLLYASCLANTPYDKADAAFAALRENFYDWNEVRVSTVTELAETMTMLPQPSLAASTLKCTLHSLFEAHYSFDLEWLRKENIGKAVAQLEKYQGIQPFSVAYVVQNALGGHAIPLDTGALKVLMVLDAASEEDAKNNHVPGLERTIPKSKGVEFGSLLHQLGADFCASPFSPAVRAIILEIDPAAKARLPKRASRKSAKAEIEAAAEQPQPDEKKTGGKKQAEKKPATAKKKTAAKKSSPSKAASKPAAKKKSAVKKKSTSRKLARKKPR